MALPVRYNMIGLLFCSTVVNYIDRVNISVAAPVIMKESGWDKGQFGLVFSAFLIGYALLQIPGGVIADRWGGRKVLALAFCGFSLFTALTPLGQSAFVLLLLMRFLVGAFESLTMPALTSLNSRWIPRAEFGRAQTLSLSGITVGQMIAYPLTTWIILHSSWPMVFYVNAALGVVWAAAWLWYATDTPGSHPSISQAERDYIATHLPPKPATPLPLRAVFTSPSLFILSLSYMCFAYVGWTFFFWFPDYLVEGRGLSLEVMGVIGVAVHGAGFVGLISGGAISDWLLRTGWSPQFARVRFPGIGVALSLPFLLGVALVSSTTTCVVLMLLFYLLFASAIAGYTTVALEFNPHLAGSIFGMLNTLGSFAGIFGPMTTGFILSQSGGNWTLPFFAATAVGAVCASILFVVPIRPIRVDTLVPTGIVAREVAH
ncbi:MAG TPA: MFS transporter [Candidatus Binatia bacterium]|nr:MFS transporter [Candidatus Binatia bacterium]